MRDTLSLPQIFGIVAEAEREQAARELGMLEVVNTAVAPIASKDNQPMFTALANRLRGLAYPRNPRNAARALFAHLKAKAKPGKPERRA